MVTGGVTDATPQPASVHVKLTRTSAFAHVPPVYVAPADVADTERSGSRLSTLIASEVVVAGFPARSMQVPLADCAGPFGCQRSFRPAQPTRTRRPESGSSHTTNDTMTSRPLHVPSTYGSSPEHRGCGDVGAPSCRWRCRRTCESWSCRGCRCRYRSRTAKPEPSDATVTGSETRRGDAGAVVAALERDRDVVVGPRSPPRTVLSHP